MSPHEVRFLSVRFLGSLISSLIRLVSSEPYVVFCGIFSPAGMPAGLFYSTECSASIRLPVDFWWFCGLRGAADASTYHGRVPLVYEKRPPVSFKPSAPLLGTQSTYTKSPFPWIEGNGLLYYSGSQIASIPMPYGDVQPAPHRRALPVRPGLQQSARR